MITNDPVNPSNNNYVYSSEIGEMAKGEGKCRGNLFFVATLID